MKRKYQLDPLLTPPSGGRRLARRLERRCRLRGSLLEARVRRESGARYALEFGAPGADRGDHCRLSDFDPAVERNAVSLDRLAEVVAVFAAPRDQSTVADQRLVSPLSKPSAKISPS